MLLNTRWLSSAAFGALVGYWTAGRVEDELRETATGGQMQNESIAAGVLVAVIVCWLAIRFWPKALWREKNPAPADSTKSAHGTDPATPSGQTTLDPAAETESTYPPSRADARVLGILAGVLSGLGIAVLTFFGPTLVNPEYSIIWFWFSWAIAPVAGIFGGAIIGSLVHHVASRPAEVAERNATRQPDLRDL